MDNTIRELVEQCTELNGQLNVDKFVKVIHNECMIQIEKNFAGAVGTHANAHNLGVSKCKKSIKTLFGMGDEEQEHV